MSNLKRTKMNVKSLLLLLAFTGFGVSCNSDDPNGDGSNDSGGLNGRSELQIAISGTGENQEYTKATATENENKIEKLEIYLFAATAQGGTYLFLEKWVEGTAYDPEHPSWNFKKTETGAGWKASLYPNELKGYPFVKLMCVANNGSQNTNDGNFYAENGTNELPPLVSLATDGNGVVNNADAATKEEDFRKAFTMKLGADAATGIIRTPLLMTGTGQTKIAGSLSKVDITLKRIVARFDIENNATKSNLTIQKISMARGRVNGLLWDATRTTVAKDDLVSPLLTTYQPVIFEDLPGANAGITESALYTYPNLETDESYLILEGTYKSPISSEQVPVTYNVPIVRTAEGDTKGKYIPVKANSRYRLKITDVTQSNVFATFEVVDWTSGGGLVVKPNNDAPVFDAVNGGFEAVTGALPTAIGDSKTKFTVAEGSEFKVQIAATGKVRYEKVATPTKTASPDWLEVGTPEYKDVDGVWYTTFTMKATNATGELPVDVTFINETASYDPALWTTLTFYGPKAAPTLTDGGAGSLGNTVDYTTDPVAPTANMYNAIGSFIKVKAMCIEGTKLLVLPAGFEEVGTAVKEGYYSTFTIQVKSALTDGNTYELQFQNEQEATAKTVVTVTAVKAKMSALLANVISDCADLTGNTIKTDLDLLDGNSYTLNITAPEGVTDVIPIGKWLTVTKGVFSNGVTPYTVTKNASVTEYADFALVFTNNLDATDKLTLTMNKAFSKPKLETATGQSAFNEAPVIAADGYTGTVNMYAAEGSQVKVKMTCAEAAAFEAVPGLTITPATKPADGIYTITVDANPTFVAGSTTKVVAKNSSDATRNATLTIKWLNPMPSFTFITDSNPAGTIDANNPDQINVDYASISAASGKYVPLGFNISAYKGSTISYTGSTNTWLKNTTIPTSVTATDTPEVIEFTQSGCGDTAETADIVITITSAIPNGGTKTITLKKK